MFIPNLHYFTTTEVLSHICCIFSACSSYQRPTHAVQRYYVANMLQTSSRQALSLTPMKYALSYFLLWRYKDIPIIYVQATKLETLLEAVIWSAKLKDLTIESVSKMTGYGWIEVQKRLVRSELDSFSQTVFLAALWPQSVVAFVSVRLYVQRCFLPSLTNILQTLKHWTNRAALVTNTAFRCQIQTYAIILVKE